MNNNKINNSQITKILTQRWIHCTKCETVLSYQETARKSYFYFNLTNKKAYCFQHSVKNKSLLKVKACLGCRDAFIDYGNNYDYCADCAVNNNRYFLNKCSECDGSGWIYFPNQAIRTCKLCALTKSGGSCIQSLCFSS